MDAQVLEIVEKVAPHEFYPSVPANFVLEDGEKVPAETVLGPDVELHCLDDDRRRALFVQTGPGVELSGVPFFYLTQYQQAERLLALDYDTVHELAAELPDPELTHIWSVGRCGSTLLSRALAAVPGVRSYSEPDVYSDIAMLRHWGGPGRDDDYAALLRSCTRLLGRRGPHLAVKFRGSGIHVAELIRAGFPAAHDLFLSRDAERWMESMHAGFTPALPRKRAMPTFLRYLGAQAPLMAPYARQHGRRPTLAESYALTWLSIMDKYVALRSAGMPFLAVDYAELTATPEETVRRILAFCGLPADCLGTVLDTFGHDSQEGTNLSRDARAAGPASPLGPDDYAELRAVLAAHPVVTTPDFR